MTDFPPIPNFGDDPWLDSQPRSMASDWRWTAIHEAGHLVASTAAGRSPISVSMLDDGSGIARNDTTPLPPMQKAVSVLCGMAAECMAGNPSPWPGGWSDMFLARASIALVVGYRHENIEEATRLIWDAACAFIAKPAVWAAIEDVAALLLLHSVLGEDELRRLLDPVRRPLPSLPDPVWQPSLFDPVPMIATGRTPSQPVVRANPTVPSTPAAKPAFRPAIATTPAASEAKGVIQLVLVVLAAVAVLALVGSNDEQRRQQQWRDVQRAMHANDAAPSSSGSARP